MYYDLCNHLNNHGSLYAFLYPSFQMIYRAIYVFKFKRPERGWNFHYLFIKKQSSSIFSYLFCFLLPFFWISCTLSTTFWIYYEFHSCNIYICIGHSSIKENQQEKRFYFPRLKKKKKLIYSLICHWAFFSVLSYHKEITSQVLVFFLYHLPFFGGWGG